MSLSFIRKSLIAISVALTIGMLGSSDADAQSRRDVERERQRVERENARWEREHQQQQVRRNGATGNRGVERRIYNANYSNGYEQGFLAGTSDARRRKYNRSNVYRNTGPYPNDGDPTSVDYIYRQGYLAGYEDGFHGRRNL